jgi:hypothetical protein
MLCFFSGDQSGLEAQGPRVGIETNLNLGAIMVGRQEKGDSFILENVLEKSRTGTELSRDYILEKQRELQFNTADT